MDSQEQDSNPSRPLLPTAGVSPGVKYFVIILTVITLLAFGIFTALMIQKFVFSSPSKNTEENRWLIVAEKLEKDGLIDQAIGQYRKFLEDAEIKPRQHSQISLKVGKLYLSLNNCSEALVWLYHAEMGASSYPWSQEVSENIQTCHQRLREAGKQ